MSTRVPSYRRHKARNCAVVTIAGKDHYLGPYGSPESREKYHRLVAEHLAARAEPAPPPTPDDPLTVAELIAAYWRFARSYYVKDGKPTSEVHAVKLALKFVRRLYGATPAGAFSPQKLKAVREAMIGHPITRRVKAADPATGEIRRVRKIVRIGMARRTINKLIGRVRRMFAWAVEEELVDAGVHAALLRLKGLRRGKSAARETARVRPVPGDHVQKVLPLVPKVVRAMIEVQRLTGCRPQDVVQLRPCDLDTAGGVWEYRPRRHKTEHHNDGGDPDLDRVVYLGPQAQAILKPLLPADPGAYLFSPGRAAADRTLARRGDRPASTQPTSTSVTAKTGRTRAPFKSHYPVASYRQAIGRACRRAGVPIWTPNQLRHSRLTEIRARYGLEASRVCGGHREVGVTQIYAEQDQDLARRVMAEVG